MTVRHDARTQRTRRGALICLASVLLSLGAGTVPAADAGGFHFWSGPPMLFGFGGKDERVAGLRMREAAAFEAVKQDDVNEVTEYLRRNGNSHVTNEMNETLVEVAAFAGHWRVLQAILRYPVPVSGEEIGVALAAAATGEKHGNDTRRVVQMLRAHVSDTELAPIAQTSGAEVR